MFRRSYCRKTITYFPLVTRQLVYTHYFLELLITICTLGRVVVTCRSSGVSADFHFRKLLEIVEDFYLMISDHQWSVFFSLVDCNYGKLWEIVEDFY